MYKINKTLPLKKGVYRIPTRDEFHRYYCGVLSIEDFSTTTPARNRIKNVDEAIKWTKKKTKRYFLFDNEVLSLIDLQQSEACYGFTTWDDDYGMVLDILGIENEGAN